MKTPAQLRTDIENSASSEIAVYCAKKLLDAMELHQLDATAIYDIPAGIEIRWDSEFTPERHAYILCGDMGLVVAKREDHASGESKSWWVINSEKLIPPGLALTTEETIEHIRCYVWADYR